MAADAIISVDEAQRITLFNKGAAAFLGYAASEVLGQSLTLRMPAEARVGTMLREVFRESDVVGRIGGDEFVVLAVGGGAATLAAQRERLDVWLAERNVRPGTAFPLSVSIGSAAYDPAAPASLEELMHAADGALYEEKRARRRRR